MERRSTVVGRNKDMGSAHRGGRGIYRIGRLWRISGIKRSIGSDKRPGARETARVVGKMEFAGFGQGQGRSLVYRGNPAGCGGVDKAGTQAALCQFKAIDGQWRQVEIDPTLHARDANLEPRFRAGKMPEAVSLDDKPLSKIWGYDSPVVAPQYEYINLKLRY